MEKSNGVLILTPLLNSLLLNRILAEKWKSMLESFPPYVLAEDYESINEMSGEPLVHVLFFFSPEMAEEAKSSINALSSISTNTSKNMAKNLAEITKEDILALQAGNWTQFIWDWDKK